MKVSYTNLKLKINTDTNIIDLNDQKIEVLQYLPIDKKYDIVEITISKSTIDNLVHPLLKEINFALNIIYSYTNINFTDKQREDELKLYDQLQSSGLIGQVYAAIPQDELIFLETILDDRIAQLEEYSNTFNYTLGKFINDIPRNMEEAKKLLENFDTDKIKDVVNLAKNAGINEKNLISDENIEKIKNFV